jgi:hypothetical protein
MRTFNQNNWYLAVDADSASNQAVIHTTNGAQLVSMRLVKSQRIQFMPATPILSIYNKNTL